MSTLHVAKEMRSILSLIILLLVAGCYEKKIEPLSVDLGILEDGMPFIDWNGTLYRDVQINGKSTFPTGSKLNATFGKNEKEGLLIISATAKLTGDNQLTLDGEYSALIPFTLNMLGTNEDNGVELSFEKGDGVIDFEGTLYTTYTK